jgi:hypothetical protein
VRLFEKNNLETFCPGHIKELLDRPSECEPTATMFRKYFPKYSNQHRNPELIGCILNTFDGGGLLWAIIILTGLFVMAAIIIAGLWWWRMTDLVGATNIGQCVLGIGTGVVGMFIAMVKASP